MERGKGRSKGPARGSRWAPGWQALGFGFALGLFLAHNCPPTFGQIWTKVLFPSCPVRSGQRTIQGQTSAKRGVGSDLGFTAELGGTPEVPWARHSSRPQARSAQPGLAGASGADLQGPAAVAQGSHSGRPSLRRATQPSAAAPRTGTQAGRDLAVPQARPGAEAARWRDQSEPGFRGRGPRQLGGGARGGASGRGRGTSAAAAPRMAVLRVALAASLAAARTRPPLGRRPPPAPCSASAGAMEPEPRWLAGLRFDNRALRALPVETPPPGPEGAPSAPRPVPGACFSRVRPAPLRQPRVVALSEPALALLGLGAPPADAAAREAREAEAALFFSGNALLPGAEPAAHCYCGHQFGQFAGQLGDGAAMYLGEVCTAAGERWELQLKGAGPTPFSRCVCARTRGAVLPGGAVGGEINYGKV